MLKLEYTSEHAQLQNSKDSPQIDCSIWFLHQRAISNCRQCCFGLLGLINFLFLRRMARPPVGSAMPAKHTHGKMARLKGGAQASQTLRGNEPHPQSEHLAKIVTKTPHTHKKAKTDTYFYEFYLCRHEHERRQWHGNEQQPNERTKTY